MLLSSYEIGQRIKKRRKTLGLSIIEVAERSGINKSTISRYECGAISKASVPTLRSIANTLYVDVAYFTGEEAEAVAPKEYTAANEIRDILQAARAQLTMQKGLLFDGKPASDEAITAILQAMEVGVTLAQDKQNNQSSLNDLRTKIEKI